MAPKKSYDGVARFFDYFRKGDMRRWGDAQKNLFQQMKGNVLHIGVGTGMEIINFPPDLFITGIDLSPKMLERALWRASQYQGRIKFCLMNSESLAFPDNTFDTIVTVCVFCTVAHPVRGLEECRRVLKPGGKLLMFEHVMSKNFIYGLSLKFMSLFTEALEGTHLDRNTVQNVKKAGFEVQSERNVYLDIVKAIEGVKPAILT
ncbi:MAG: SAM-dependent methyltransferase [Nitrospinaceae bacterium]|nr:MAG: SAM-dependent methyltransferase [Nitrospinaceae bacterium]